MKTALKDDNRTYGVEMEVVSALTGHEIARALTAAGLPCQYEGYNHRTRNQWKIVYDSSVNSRGRRGLELVSPPLKGKEGLDQIELVCSVLNGLDVKINRTCGLHVHHDAKGFGADNFVRIMNYYARIEKHLDSMMPASRRANANGFLRSCADHRLGSPTYLAEAQFSSRSRSDIRYAKVNVNAFHQHGTVEFRHHAGTIDADKIVAWVILTQRIVDKFKGTRKVATCKTSSWKKELKGLGFNTDKMSEMTDDERAVVEYTQRRIAHFKARERVARERVARRLYRHVA